MVNVEPYAFHFLCSEGALHYNHLCGAVHRIYSDDCSSVPDVDRSNDMETVWMVSTFHFAQCGVAHGTTFQVSRETSSVDVVVDAEA